MDLLILVTLGTQDKPFKRLIQEVEKQIELGNIKEKVIVQAGNTKYKSDKMQIYDFIKIEQFNKYIEEAQYIITHAGVATIINGIRNNKKMIVAARRAEYGEHVNDHQLQILDNFAQEGYIVPVYELEKLDEAIEKIKTHEVKRLESNNDAFRRNLKKVINDL